MIELEKIIETLKPFKVVGNSKKSIERVVTTAELNGNNGLISWINEKNKEKCYTLPGGVIIAPESVDVNKLPEKCTFLLFKNPRKAFQDLLNNFFVDKKPLEFISPTAVIGKNVTIGKNAYIGNCTIIEDNVKIGENVFIGNFNTILSGTIIKNNVNIISNNVIGAAGFGYEKNDTGKYEQMPHIGNVIINSFVDIGSNNCIDRSVLGSTIIGEHTKIHNFVQIAHGVTIGENCLVTANVTISGGTEIGNEVWIGPGVTIVNKINIGDNAHLSVGAVIFTNVPKDEKVVGNPARIIKSIN